MPGCGVGRVGVVRGAGWAGSVWCGVGVVRVGVGEGSVWMRWNGAGWSGGVVGRDGLG